MVDEGPNPVTPEGMAQIDGHVARIEAALKTETNVLLRETLAYHSPLADFACAMQGLGSGAITLAAGLRRQVPLAGLIALSTYLPGASQAARHRVAAATAQPVFMAHGTGDPVIPLIHAEQSAQALGELGFDVEWHRYPMAHQVCAEEIRDLGDWMGRRFAL